MPTIEEAARIADELISGEVTTQDKMWDRDNSAADYSNGELMHAAQASTFLAILQNDNPPLSEAQLDHCVKLSRDAFYPDTWSGFRDYGPVYNLIVAAAFLRNQAKLLIANGGDYARKPRQPEQAYNAETGLPRVSSAEARGEA